MNPYVTLKCGSYVGKSQFDNNDSRTQSNLRPSRFAAGKKVRCFIVIVSLCGIISVFDGGKSSRACRQYKSSNIIHKNSEKPPKNIEVKCWPLEFELDRIGLLT